MNNLYRRGNIYRKTRMCCCCKDICTPQFINLFSCLFDGVDEHINCGNDISLSFGNGSSDNAFSISVWVKTDDFLAARIISKGVYNSDAEYIFSTDGDGLLYLHIMDESVANCYIGRKSTSLLAYQNQWVHLVATYNGNGINSGIKLYLNGVQFDNVDSGLNAGSYVAMERLLHDVWIGRYSSSYFSGNIDEVSIWKKELNQYDINNIYNNGNPCNLNCHIASSDLISWWRMGDGDTHPTLKDSIGVNDGTMINMENSDIVKDTV